MTHTAFEGSRRIAAGNLAGVRAEVVRLGGTGLVFEDETGRQVDLDFREEAVASAVIDEPRRVGRPKLGVVSKEVTLLPRHWEWLGRQPGGASGTLRRLVDGARNVSSEKDRVRQSQEAAYRFLSAMAGNEAGFEEAMRALFACKRESFEEQVRNWPIDVRDYGRQLAGGAFEDMTIKR